MASEVNLVELKELVEDLAAVADQVFDSPAELCFEHLLRIAKRAAAGNQHERHLLIRAIARHEAARQPVPADPELAK